MYTSKNYSQAKKEVPQQNKRWTEVEGEMRIFKKEFGDHNVYSTSISRKKESGEWANVYIRVNGKMLNEVDIPKEGRIFEVEGFWSLNLYKDEVIPCIVITAIKS